jgi:hypothetical protein
MNSRQLLVAMNDAALELHSQNTCSLLLQLHKDAKAANDDYLTEVFAAASDDYLAGRMSVAQVQSMLRSEAASLAVGVL